jgi:hypothetical protein
MIPAFCNVAAGALELKSDERTEESGLPVTHQLTTPDFPEPDFGARFSQHGCARTRRSQKSSGLPANRG